MKNTIVFLSLSLLFLACSSDNPKTIEAEEFGEQESREVPNLIAEIEQAHERNQWYKNELVSFDLEMYFGGKARFVGTINMTPDGGLVRMQDSSKTMIWDGEQAWISPDTISYQRARFDLLTWSYFFAAPYKFSDPGVIYNEASQRKLEGDDFSSIKIAFESGVGDSPDDWYRIYQNPSSNLLEAMAYIVTYSKSQEQAEEDPHLIRYHDYREFDQLPIATKWTFHSWNKLGELEKLLGRAMISNVEFNKKAEGLFKPSAEFRTSEK